MRKKIKYDYNKKVHGFQTNWLQLKNKSHFFRCSHSLYSDPFILLFTFFSFFPTSLPYLQPSCEQKLVLIETKSPFRWMFKVTSPLVRQAQRLLRLYRPTIYQELFEAWDFCNVNYCYKRFFLEIFYNYVDIGGYTMYTWSI